MLGIEFDGLIEIHDGVVVVLPVQINSAAIGEGDREILRRLGRGLDDRGAAFQPLLCRRAGGRRADLKGVGLLGQRNNTRHQSGAHQHHTRQDAHHAFLGASDRLVRA